MFELCKRCFGRGGWLSRTCRYHKGIGQQFYRGAIKGFVRRRSIVILCSFEVLVCGLLSWAYYAHDGVAKLGRLFHWNMLYVIIAGFRSLCGILAIWAAWFRKVKSMKVYYRFLIANHFLFIVMALPWLRLNCRATSYFQVEAVLSFGVQPPLLVNPLPPPEKKYLAGQRVLDYAEIPQDYKEAQATGATELELERAQYQTAPWFRPAEGETELERKAAPLSPWSKDANDEDFGPASVEFLEGDNKWLETGEVSWRPESDDDCLKVTSYFQAIPKDLVFASLTTPECITIDDGVEMNALGETMVDWGKLGEYKLKLCKLEYTDWEETPIFKKQLNLCLANRECVAIQVNKAPGSYELCRYHDEAWPSKPAEPPKDVFTLMKNKAYATTAHALRTLNNRAGHEALFKDRAQNATHILVADVAEYLRKVQQSSCRCSPDSSSCQAYYSGTKGFWRFPVGTQARYWCWVSLSTLPACLAQGIKVYRDSSYRWWSMDLCHTVAGCRCSFIGMHPRDIKEYNEELKTSEEWSRNKEGKLDNWTPWANRFDYGMTCRFWRKTDERPWCWVGFDTYCADREFGSRGHPQYKSSVACQDNKKFEPLEGTCRLWKYLATFLLVLLWLASWPLTAIVIRFLENRCGDLIEIDQQFEVDFSDEDSGDDFEVTAAKLPKNRGRSFFGRLRTSSLES